MSASPPRLLAAVLVLGVLAATCDGSGSAVSTDGSADPTTQGSTQPPPTAQGQVLSYGFEAGDTYTYDLALDQHIVLESEGSTAAISEDDLPTSADVTVTATGKFVYEVSAGPEEGTYSVAIDGSFTDVTVDGTADGEPVDDVADIEQLGTIDPVSTVVVVDSQGRVTQGPTSPTDALGLGATPLAGLSGDLGRMVGPVLSAEPVAVGDTWTETSTDPNLGDEPVETTVIATLSGTESIDGVETLVIEVESSTGEANIDLAEFFAGFMGAFTDPDDPQATADLEEMADNIVFRITIAPSSGQETTWFDPEVGLALRSTTTGPPTVFRMEVALPDEDTGELESYDMHLDVAQTLDYTLVPGG